MSRARKKEARAPRSDRDFGGEVRTSRQVSIQKLGLEGENKEQANRYEPTPFAVFETIMQHIDVEPERFTFVDLGAGKGRVLCLASAWPFRRIVGVELSKELGAAARHNVSKMAAPWQKCRRFEVVIGDAARWEPPEEPLILYLFNPFGREVLARVIDRIQASYDAAPREIYVLYYMPVHIDLRARAPCLRPHAAGKDWTIWIATIEASR